MFLSRDLELADVFESKKDHTLLAGISARVKFLSKKVWGRDMEKGKAALGITDEIYTTLPEDMRIAFPKDITEMLIRNLKMRILSGEALEQALIAEQDCMLDAFLQNNIFKRIFGKISMEALMKKIIEYTQTVASMTIMQVTQVRKRSQDYACSEITLGESYPYTTKKGKKIIVVPEKETADGFLVLKEGNRMFAVRKAEFIKNVFGKDSTDKVYDELERVFYRSEPVIYTNNKGEKIEAKVLSESPDGGLILQDQNNILRAISPAGLYRVEQSIDPLQKYSLRTFDDVAKYIHDMSLRTFLAISITLGGLEILPNSTKNQIQSLLVEAPIEQVQKS